MDQRRASKLRSPSPFFCFARDEAFAFFAGSRNCRGGRDMIGSYTTDRPAASSRTIALMRKAAVSTSKTTQPKTEKRRPAPTLHQFTSAPPSNLSYAVGATVLAFPGGRCEYNIGMQSVPRRLSPDAPTRGRAESPAVPRKDVPG